MGMPLKQWDKQIAPILRDIEVQAGWASIHAERVRKLTRKLTVKPGFDSRARDELSRAMVSLKETLAAVQEAIMDYDAKFADE